MAVSEEEEEEEDLSFLDWRGSVKANCWLMVEEEDEEEEARASTIWVRWHGTKEEERKEVALLHHPFASLWAFSMRCWDWLLLPPVEEEEDEEDEMSEKLDKDLILFMHLIAPITWSKYSWKPNTTATNGIIKIKEIETSLANSSSKMEERVVNCWSSKHWNHSKHKRSLPLSKIDPFHRIKPSNTSLCLQKTNNKLQ